MTLLVLLLCLAAPLTHATCDPSDEPCQVGSGSCSSAVRMAINGDILNASNALYYGKYCGALNKCVPENGSRSGSKRGKKTKSSDSSSKSSSMEDNNDDTSTCKAPKGSRRYLHRGKKKEEDTTCPVEACDAIDTSCSIHDACLDEILLNNPLPPGTTRIPVPQRCPCDVNFVFDLAVEASTATEPTGLCDAEFYTEPISAEHLPLTPIQLLQHESVLMAAPFCCDVILDQNNNGFPDCGEEDPSKVDPAKFIVANQFCDNLLTGLRNAGIPICEKKMLYYY